MSYEWSHDIVIARLPAKPLTGDELSALANKLAVDMPEADLMVDLGAVAELTCKYITTLKVLSDVLRERGCSCMFYNLNAVARQTFYRRGFDKIFQVLEASEVELKPSTGKMSHGILELHSSMERRKYVRLRIPSWLQVDVRIWHGGRKDDYHKLLPGHFWHGRLVDISEGGMQVAIYPSGTAILEKGRLMGIEFRPNAAESIQTFDARIVELLPTADGRNICIGLQFIAMEANPEGLKSLKRLCGIDSTCYEAKKNMTV